MELNFDRETDLRELLSGIGLDRLKEDLSLLLGDFSLSTSEGVVILGSKPGIGTKIPLKAELEPIGFLESSSADEAKMRGAAHMIESLLKLGKLYRMASELHLETVDADYEVLRESEEKYRRLASELDERVKVQVETIEMAQRRLYQAEKLASVGRLAAGVAHEINNPAGFVRSNLSTAKSYIKTLQGLAEKFWAGDAAAFSAYWKNKDMDFILEDFGMLLDESIAGIDRVARIVADLKGFSNVDGAAREMADLNENLRSACNMISGQIGGRITLDADLEKLPELLCFPAHINQMFLNILLNAVQSISEKGRIAVQSRSAGNDIVIRIRDDGCGIPEDILPKIFDPFFTTREVGSGTGLGLTVSRDIAQAHGGRIGVESFPGRGTTVTIVLPCSNGA